MNIAEETVMNILKKENRPLKAGEISELSGIEKKEVDKVIKTLKKQEKIISPKRCFYVPNE